MQGFAIRRRRGGEINELLGVVEAASRESRILLVLAERCSMFHVPFKTASPGAPSALGMRTLTHYKSLALLEFYYLLLPARRMHAGQAGEQSVCALVYV